APAGGALQRPGTRGRCRRYCSGIAAVEGCPARAATEKGPPGGSSATSLPVQAQRLPCDLEVERRNRVIVEGACYPVRAGRQSQQRAGRGAAAAREQPAVGTCSLLTRADRLH